MSGPAVEAPRGASAELAGLLRQLRSAVFGYVAERRTAGLAVERVIPEVKCVVREALSSERWPDSTEALTTQVVQWTILAYYDRADPAHVPRFY